MAFVKRFTDGAAATGYSWCQDATTGTERGHSLMNAIATRTSTRCPTGIDVKRTASALVGTYGEDAALIAKKWAAVVQFCGDTARARDWSDIVNDIERRAGAA